MFYTLASLWLRPVYSMLCLFFPGTCLISLLLPESCRDDQSKSVLLYHLRHPQVFCHWKHNDKIWADLSPPLPKRKQTSSVCSTFCVSYSVFDVSPASWGGHWGRVWRARSCMSRRWVGREMLSVPVCSNHICPVPGCTLIIALLFSCAAPCVLCKVHCHYIQVELTVLFYD